MDGIAIIASVVVGVFSVVLSAFAISGWLLKRYISRNDSKLDQIIKEIQGLRGELYREYTRTEDFEARFAVLKADLQRELELRFQVLQAQAAGTSTPPT